MAETGTTLLTLVPVTVTTPGTAVQVPTTGKSFAAKSVIVQALPENEENVVVGDASVKAKLGSHATPEVRGIELAPKATVSIDICDATQIWVDARKAKDGILVTILLA